MPAMGNIGGASSRWMKFFVTDVCRYRCEPSDIDMRLELEIHDGGMSEAVRKRYQYWEMGEEFGAILPATAAVATFPCSLTVKDGRQ